MKWTTGYQYKGSLIVTLSKSSGGGTWNLPCASPSSKIYSWTISFFNYFLNFSKNSSWSRSRAKSWTAGISEILISLLMMTLSNISPAWVIKSSIIRWPFGKNTSWFLKKKSWLGLNNSTEIKDNLLPQSIWNDESNLLECHLKEVCALYKICPRIIMYLK